MRRKIDPLARRLSQRLDRASEIIPNIRRHLREQRHHVNAVAGTDYDATRSGSGVSDPTSRTALELGRLDYREGLIDDALQSIQVGINLLDDACRDALGHRAPDLEHPPPADPVCYVAECHDPVGSYRLDDGSIRFRMGGEYGGMCDRHRVAAGRT